MEPLAGIISPPEGQLQKNAGYAKPGDHACPLHVKLPDKSAKLHL